MTKLFFILSNKGGVGKTVIARAFADYLRYNSIKTAIYDTSAENHSLKSIYGKNNDDPLTGVAQSNLECNLTSWMDDIINLNADISLIDTQSGCLNHLIKDNNLYRLNNFSITNNIQIHMIIPLNEEEQTIQTACEAVEALGIHAKYHFFENIPNTKEHQRAMGIWNDIPKYFQEITGNNEQTFKKFILAHGSYHYFPRLDISIENWMKLLHLPYREALNHPSTEFYSRDLRKWIEQTDSIFANLVTF